MMSYPLYHDVLWCQVLWWCLIISFNSLSSTVKMSCDDMSHFGIYAKYAKKVNCWKLPMVSIIFFHANQTLQILNISNSINWLLAYNTFARNKNCTKVHIDHYLWKNCLRHSFKRNNYLLFCNQHQLKTIGGLWAYVLYCVCSKNIIDPNCVTFYNNTKFDITMLRLQLNFKVSAPQQNWGANTQWHTGNQRKLLILRLQSNYSHYPDNFLQICEPSWKHIVN